MLHWKHSAKQGQLVQWLLQCLWTCNFLPYLPPPERKKNTFASSFCDTWSAAYLKTKYNPINLALFKYCLCWNVSWNSILISWSTSCDLHRWFLVCAEEGDIRNSNERPSFTGPELYDRALLRDLRGSIEVSEADTAQVCSKANQNVPENRQPHPTPHKTEEKNQ